MEQQALSKVELKPAEVPYQQLVQTKEFQTVVKQKRAFILPVTIFFLSFYFLLPILAAYTDLLKGEAFFGLTWAWVYALMQFVVVWVGGIVYIKKSEKYDILASKVLETYRKELGQ
ncbi:uncharacterized membrane protein (DUF485 family) [Bacillus ectoiniformans]|uniref:DUF485 domain-containing protein n=1 Tax=Bacillus ectoiniformans TaxID=1494429 RepID=UPI001956BFD7|nr:DUF485 domain-containing protein [Bacillus ectoiniformans]MBM7649153.1 uncharacterized membrane protein (DUF485 family) [Bacillus ectoiniformans]